MQPLSTIVFVNINIVQKLANVNNFFNKTVKNPLLFEKFNNFTLFFS